MKHFRVGLLPRILLAILLGVLFGQFLPLWGVRFFLTINGIFSQFLGFAIPLIILGLVTVAIADIGRGAGRMLLATTLIAYTSTVLAGFLSFFTGEALFPSLISPGVGLQEVVSSTDSTPFFSIEITPPMGVMTALVLAFTLGLGLAYIRGTTLKAVMHDFQEVIVKTISSVILPLLPIYIFGIFLDITYSGKVLTVLAAFMKIIGVIFALHIIVLLLQYAIAGMVTRRNPLPLLWRMMPAYFTALGTQSSAATIPVTMEQTCRNGVRSEVSGFVIPLCATIHMSGSILKIVACALALMIMQSMPYTTSQFVGFIFMLAVTMVAAPGVPGGCIMAALGLLQSMLGFDPEAQALMIALYIAMDNFGTACNVTGDGAIALVIDRLFGRSISPTKKTD